MTEKEWQSCNDARRMLEFLRGKASARKWRLFVCGFIRLDSNADIIDEESEAALETSERYADGHATLAELQEASRKARQARRVSGAAIWAPVATASDVKWAVERLFGVGGLTTPSIERQRVQVFHDLWGPLPFRQVPIDGNWLTPQVIEIAQRIYDDRTFDQMRDLAGALEDAGCHDADILDHCRRRAAHVRGCWVINAILGKELISEDGEPGNAARA